MIATVRLELAILKMLTSKNYRQPSKLPVLDEHTRFVKYCFFCFLSLFWLLYFHLFELLKLAAEKVIRGVLY